MGRHTLGVFDLGERVTELNLVQCEFVLIHQLDASIVATTNDVKI